MTNQKPNPKEFYDSVMSGKLGENYEAARWKSSPLRVAQYAMTADALQAYTLPLLRTARTILEVGPGPGTWTKLLLGVNTEAQYTLVDISGEMLGQAREGLTGRTSVSFVESDFLAFESPQPFDFFFSSRAIEYMPDKRAAVEKVASLLTPGAHGVIITKMPKQFFNRLRGRKIADLHKGQIASRNLVHLLEQSGCIVEKVCIATATLPGFGSARANGLVYTLLKHIPLFFPFTLFAESYIVIFRKPL